MSSDKYIHSDVEDKIYSYWEKNELFRPKENKKKFSIVIPPPNVTGSLHMGHALNNSIQDLLVRFHRMNNFETLWQPGTDHAGIATQALVERKLATEKIDKNEIGREKFNIKRLLKLLAIQDGNVAEWLRRGLQILVSRFDSGRCLQKKSCFSSKKKYVEFFTFLGSSVGRAVDC